MVKSQRYLRVGIIVLCTIIAVSCSKRKPSYNRENLKATWIMNMYDGNLLDADNWTIYSFGTTGSVTLSGIMTDTSGNRQWGNDDVFFDAYCCDVTIYGDISGLSGIPESRTIYQTYDFNTSEDSLVILNILTNKINDQDVPAEYSTMTLRKIPASYEKADSLIGIWQFSTRDGEDFDRYRLQFAASKALTFYYRNESDEWVTTGGETGDIYNKYYDFVALTIYDNSYIGTSSKWDVACLSDFYASPFNSYMTFSFNGHTYTLTYVSAID